MTWCLPTRRPPTWRLPTRQLRTWRRRLWPSPIWSRTPWCWPIRCLATCRLDDLALDDLALEDGDLDDGSLDPDLGGPAGLPTDATLDLRQRVPDLPLASDLDLRPPPALPPAGPALLDLPEIRLADLDEAPLVLPDLEDLPPVQAPVPAADAAADTARSVAMGLLPEATELDLAQDFDATFGLVDAPAADAEAAAATDLPAAAELQDGLPDGTASAGTDAEPEPEPEPEPESYRQIGPLRIGVPLFNIYLGEADELSRRLGLELAEWALEPARPVGEAAVALAHSLAGSSGTVGYADLSSLSRALEHALERSQARGHGRGDEPALFLQVSDEIRRLLHLFAAGYLHAPDPALVTRLLALGHAAPEAAEPDALAPAPAADTTPAPAADTTPAPAADPHLRQLQTPRSRQLQTPRLRQLPTAWPSPLSRPCHNRQLNPRPRPRPSRDRAETGRDRAGRSADLLPDLAAAPTDTPADIPADPPADPPAASPADTPEHGRCASGCGHARRAGAAATAAGRGLPG